MRGCRRAGRIAVKSKMFDGISHFVIQWTGVVFPIVSLLILIYASVRNVTSGAPQVIPPKPKPSARRKNHEFSVEVESDIPAS